MDYIERIAASGALEKGHFVGKSGGHLTAYVDKSKIRKNRPLVKRLTLDIARIYKNMGVEVVVAPAVGAISFGDAVCDHLEKQTSTPCISLFAEKDGDGFIFKRGYAEDVKGMKVLIVEDITTSGASALKVGQLVKESGGQIVGYAIIWNRGGQKVVRAFADTKFFAVVNHEYPEFTLEECREKGPCSKGIPINTVLGHGKAFVFEHGQP